MIEFDINLGKCVCGCHAELVAEAIAEAKYDHTGCQTTMHFVDRPCYIVRCTGCDRETLWDCNIENVCRLWNERKFSPYCIKE